MWQELPATAVDPALQAVLVAFPFSIALVRREESNSNQEKRSKDRRECSLWIVSEHLPVMVAEALEASLDSDMLEYSLSTVFVHRHWLDPVPVGCLEADMLEFLLSIGAVHPETLEAEPWDFLAGSLALASEE